MSLEDYVKASLSMQGPFLLSEVEKKTKNIQIGNYAFGKVDGGKFVVYYIGRSRAGLLREINQRIDDEKAKGCTHFAFSIANSQTEAYERECQNYHDLKPRYNDIHPAKPKDNGHYKCPVKGCEYHN